MLTGLPMQLASGMSCSDVDLTGWLPLSHTVL